MNRFLALVVLFVIGGVGFFDAALAKPELAPIFGDHMVLQHGQTVPFWGWADPGEAITVEFMGQSLRTTADENGRWQVELSPLAVSTEPAVLKVIGTEMIVVQDVLVGEVWICSGQSNMEWTINSSAVPEKVRSEADLALIRHIKIPKVPSNLPVDRFSAPWQVTTPQTVGYFSAVGYHFAVNLFQELGTPIGLVNASWGGTRIEPWVPREGFELIESRPFATAPLNEVKKLDNLSTIKTVELNKQLNELEQYLAKARKDLEQGNHPMSIPVLSDLKQPNHQTPARLYRGMIHPFVPFAIRGAIWYQGESNAGQAHEYADYTRALVEGWRTVWDQGAFPFYWVQLANFRPDLNQPNENPGWATLREAQTQAMNLPNSGMAVIIDIGNSNDIHPKNKQDVGKRLAQWALTQTYGKDGVPCGPMYRTHQVIDNEIHIEFDHVGQGLIVGKKPGLDPLKEIVEGELKRFAIAGEDRQWVWGEARIKGDTVIVSSPEIDQPVAVRYAFSNNPLGANLYNRDGFPAGPFRTDRW